MKKFLHIMKRTSVVLLKTFGVLLVTIILLLVTVVAAFFIVPEFQIKSDRLKYLVTRFAPEDIKLKWEDAGLRVIKTGALSKDIVLELNGACLNYKGEAIDACFDRLFWGLGVSISNFNPRLTQFVPLIVTGGKIKGDAALLESAEPEVPEEPGGFSIVDFARNELLPKWKWNGSIVELREIDFKIDGKRMTGAVLLETQGSWNQSPLAQEADRLKVQISERDVTEQYLRLSVIGFNLPSLLKANAQLHVVLPEGETKGWIVTLKGDTQFTDGKRILVESQNKILDWQTADFKVDASLKNIEYVRQVALRGEYRKDTVAGVVGAKMGGVHSQIKTLDFVDCNFNLALTDKSATVRCGPQTVVLGLQERAEFTDQNLFRLHPTLDLKVSNFSYENGIEANWDLKLGLDHMQTLKARIDAFGSVLQAGATDTEEAKLRYSVDADIDVQITEFKRLVNLVRSTPFAVPAPFNQMQGTIQLTSSGAINETGGNIPFRLQTRLNGEHQKLDTTLGGGLALKVENGSFAPALFVDFQLEDVRLSLPRIEVTSTPPQFLPDSRFRKGLAKDKPPTDEGEAGGGLSYQVRVATAKPSAVRIATNVTGAPLPITFRYSMKSLPAGERAPAPSSPQMRPAAVTSSKPKPPTAESDGEVNVARTPIDLRNANKLLAKFQRDAVIDYFNLKMEPDGEQKIDARLLVKTPDAEIRVLILGTTDQPVIRLESEPPADESQILAALLFNRPLDQIDEAQAESAAQAKTALNDTALTLVQVFLLANSPIDSLNYDAESGRVVASIGVGKGTSLELGGASGAGTEVGLKRRIARNVYLNTYVETEAQTQERVVSAFVEWVRRF